MPDLAVIQVASAANGNASNASASASASASAAAAAASNADSGAMFALPGVGMFLRLLAGDDAGPAQSPPVDVLLAATQKATDQNSCVLALICVITLCRFISCCQVND